MKKRLFLLVFIIVNEAAMAQDTLKLSLSDALNAALKNNAEIALATLDQESAERKFNQANAVFLPQVNITYTAMATDNPLNAFGFRLQQQSVSPADFNPVLLNNPSATKNFMTRVEWSQPLINLDMVYQRKAARQQIEVFYFKKERMKEYVNFEVQKTYAQLQLSHQAVRVLEESLRTVNAIQERSKNYFDKGYLQKSDLLLVQVQVASIESKLAEAKSNVRNVSEYLALLMGTIERPIYAVDSLEKITPYAGVATQIPQDRSDFKALASALKAQDIMVQSSRLTQLPKLNAFANYMLNDKTITGFGSGSYLIGAQLSWNLFNGTSSYYRTAEQKIGRSKLARQLDYQIEQGQLELDKTLRQLQDAQFSIQQHEVAVGQANEALRIHQNRFAQGLVSITDVLQSQATSAEQKLLLAQAYFQYNSTAAYLDFLTITSENK